MVESYTFFHNTDTCIGCGACQVACKDQHNLREGEFFRRVVQLWPEGTSKPHFYSAACCHCENPACVAACPNDAFFRAPDGTVLHDDGKCISCGRCVWSCPFGAISLSKTRGVAQKCDGCIDRRRQGLEPACVAACVNGSLQFARTDGRCTEAESDPAKLLDGQTHPRIRVHWAGITDGEASHETI